MTTSNQAPLWSDAQKTGLAGLIVAWIASAYFIGSGQWLANTAHFPIPPIAITAILPVALFFAAYSWSSRFRAFVLAQDIRTLTMLHLWRVIGFTFLTLYAYGVLPALFAWPAGWGDVAIGIGAFFMVARMDRDPDYATSPGLVRFHLLGLLDFVAAVATAGLAAGGFPDLTANGITSAPMDVWPLNIFPSFGVPAFIIVHAMVLLKVRNLRRSARDNVQGVPQLV
jgi:hypothetical protein